MTFASGDAGAARAQPEELRRRRDSFGLSGDPALAVQAAADGGVVLIATTGAAAAGARARPREKR